VKGTTAISKARPGPYPLVTTGEERKLADHHQLEGPAVCVPMISSAGHGRASLKRVLYQEGKFALSNLLTALPVRDSDQLSPRFLHLYLNTFKDELIVPLMTGAANMTLTAARLAAVPVRYPPLDAQDRIVRILDAADELRRLRAEADSVTGELVPAVFDEMFGNPLTNPRGFRVISLSDVVDRLQGGRNVAPDGVATDATKYRVLKISAVTWGDYRSDENKPVPVDYDPPESHIVRLGDLLFSRANTTELVGATSYVFESPPNILLPDKIWRFVWKQPSVVEPFYVWWTLRHPAVRTELGRRSTGTGGSMKNISMPKLMSLSIPLPPLSLQQSFASHVLEVRELERRQAESRRQLDALYESLLHRAFRGEL
jgi:type I restriction enzyme S subunit